jgi:hypothetical protein
MAIEKSSDSRKARDDDEEVEIPSAGEATVQTREKPPQAPPGKTIHPRRPMPPVPDADCSEEN